MQLNNIINIFEDRGSSTFDYKYWFWAKRNNQYGIGYIRRENLPTIDFETEKTTDNLVNVNIKRIETITQLFESPIIIWWIDPLRFKAQKNFENEKTESLVKMNEYSIVTIPTKIEKDVTTEDGKEFNIKDIFLDPNTREAVTNTSQKIGKETIQLPPMLDFKFNINDENGDSLNTIFAKYIYEIFYKNTKQTADNKRKIARTKTIPSIMANLKIKSKTKKGEEVELVAFSKSDYKLLPEGYTSKKFFDIKSKMNISKWLREKQDALIKKAKGNFGE